MQDVIFALKEKKNTVNTNSSLNSAVYVQCEPLFHRLSHKLITERTSDFN